ncbi:Fc receptor-like protein 5 [Mugil cephalus]|uniref:Fc receptor-like protein 5 n=1 Tax=Mugil cephalus TaxID=48193 RepID=UPI001FB56E16|nr:Fc receptor-like protein 5 [Mugil cephalus]
MRCDVPGSFSGWTVIRNTSTKSFDPCTNKWGRLNGTTCKNRHVFKTDEGQYWCKSDQGECSNVINITVNTGDVILESPALPVTEGDKVTLRCSYKELYQKSRSDFNTTFYKDDVFIDAQPEGKIIPKVSKSDEGFYKCKHPQKGQSPQSFLAVKARADGRKSDLCNLCSSGAGMISLCWDKRRRRALYYLE